MKNIKLHFLKIFSVIIQVLIFAGLIFGLSILMLQINVLLSWLFLITFYLLNVIFVFIIYAQKRQTNAKISWIYLIMLFPIVGHILFLTFGLIFVNKHELAIVNDPKYQYETYFKNDVPKLNDHVMEALSKFNKTEPLPAQYTFYNEGYRFYQDLIDNIKETKHSILIVSYIIKKSEITTEFIDIIKQKLAEGVKVYWLVDDFGVYPSQKKQLRKLTKLGAKIFFIGKIYYPFINATSFSRNHQKFVILDSKIVYSGGNNISDEYASLSKKYGHWIDLNYKISGPYVNKYNIWFAHFWDIITREKLDVNSLICEQETKNTNANALLVVDSPSFDYSNSEYYWLKLFSEARQSIKISTPYFAITNSLEKQIILALKSGVDVTVYIPGLPDKKLVYQVTLKQLKYLMQYGLKVKIYNNCFLHSKAGIIDDKYAWVGTNNLDSRSMFSQYETMDVFEGQAVTKLNEIFEIYSQNCTDFKEMSELEKNKTAFGRFLANWTKPLI
ncbi:phospholipase D-like domain-containing protein [Mycoplasma hafezii]|uniref:phospholipase D-like domain-containing protein n=1 Tax=Mycoplasma hafezii TaxID=525886 RepID=UPI003CF47E6C